MHSHDFECGRLAAPIFIFSFALMNETRSCYSLIKTMFIVCDEKVIQGDPEQSDWVGKRTNPHKKVKYSTKKYYY